MSDASRYQRNSLGESVYTGVDLEASEMGGHERRRVVAGGPGDSLRDLEVKALSGPRLMTRTRYNGPLTGLTDLTRNTQLKAHRQSESDFQTYRQGNEDQWDDKSDRRSSKTCCNRAGWSGRRGTYLGEGNLNG